MSAASGQLVMDIGGVDVAESSTDEPPAAVPAGDAGTGSGGLQLGAAPTRIPREHRSAPLQTRAEARQAGDLAVAVTVVTVVTPLGSWE